MIQKLLGIRPKPIFSHGKPVRDSKYLKFIRRFPSVVSGRYGCDSCHTGPHGTGQRASDLTAIPLTRVEHREFDKCQWRYAERHGFEVAELVVKFNGLYALERAA